ncbi:unnamed protein product [Zymoseptoria tritici ST99CH_1E4]|uniref:Amidase domain-containing protein n=1 Tax=Zymoseptoria tritici ST99CH_1E4 TaxID=1276532 RepID=A0A2H1GTL0_ZYMTR|nr:unnamed protein product [Zymoseptoria tritici ST99CH_1E4]
MPEQWGDISAKAKQKVLDDIPSEWKIPSEKLPSGDVLDVTDFPAQSGILSQQDLDITDSFAVDIVAKIAKGEWTSEDVTRAFCKRAAIAHQLVNCLTVIMFDDGIERAKQLDAEFKRTGKVTGPLHGLPISLKDNFNVPGYPSSVGFCSWATEPMQTESTIVKTLRDLGAVFYVKTNVPTAMMIPESVNNTYGRTLNPLNRKTTSGGSSGGESALVCLKGSPLGVGTDIGGSVRIPSACTGIFTIKPSHGRFPQTGARSALAGQEAVASVNSGMARSIADVRLYAKNVVDSAPWLRDHNCIEIPWRSVELKAKPKIAVFRDDGYIQPTPPVSRALEETVAKLKAKGYEIVEWDNTCHLEIYQIVGKLFVADGGKSLEKIVQASEEPWRPELKMYQDATELGVHELWQIQAHRTALAKQYLERWAAVEGLDAILGPVTPYASPKHGEFRHVGYTAVFNVLDYSSSSFPTGVYVDKEKDVVPDGLKTHSDLDAQTQREYDPVLSHGLPVSLQLTGRRLQEEKILALTEKIIEDLKA